MSDFCRECETELAYVECDACGGDGDFDVLADWVSPGQRIICDQCNGEGGYWVCPTCQPDLLLSLDEE